MKTYTEIRPHLLERSSLALGFFDGVHPGHQAVIKTAVEAARQLSVVPAMVTFREHPRELTLGKSPPLLTLPEQRLELAADMGIEAVLLLSFTEDLCRLSPAEYVQTVLLECMGAVSLSIGYNHTFGRNREGNPAVLRQLGREHGFEVHVAGEVMVDGIEVSSSKIREALQSGNLATANKLLARRYAVRGTVKSGEGRGKLLGFPTANLESAECLVLPARGVYSGVCRVNGETHACVVNIGVRPTFGEALAPSTEVHILDFSGELYGREMTVWFVSFLRQEKKFTSTDELKMQIARDCEAARQEITRKGKSIPSVCGSLP